MIRIICSGSSGFLCSNLLPFLRNKGIEVTSIDDFAKKPIDIIRPFHLKLTQKYDTVIHAAGKAHVIPITEGDKKVFYQVNYEGTKNFCKALQSSGNLPPNFIFISTVAVYGCDVGEDIGEDHPLKGTSPYAKSKIEAEKWLTDWAKENKVNLLIFRLPLIAGINPPGNLGAMLHGIKTGKYFRIGKGDTKKSVVLVSDIADIIAKSIGKRGIYNLTDRYHPSFRELENLIASQLGKKPPKAIPLFWARLAGIVGDILGDKFPLNSARLSKITGTLTFNDDKARKELNWNPQRVLDGFKIS